MQQADPQYSDQSISYSHDSRKWLSLNTPHHANHTLHACKPNLRRSSPSSSSAPDGVFKCISLISSKPTINNHITWTDHHLSQKSNLSKSDRRLPHEDEDEGVSGGEEEDDKYQCAVPFAWEDRPGKAKPSPRMHSNSFRKRRPDQEYAGSRAASNSLGDRDLKAGDQEEEEEMKLKAAADRIVPLRLPPRLQCRTTSTTRSSSPFPRADLLPKSLFEPASTSGKAISFIAGDELHKMQTKFKKKQLHHHHHHHQPLPTMDDKTRTQHADHPPVIIQRKMEGSDKLINQNGCHRDYKKQWQLDQSAKDRSPTPKLFSMGKLQHQAATKQKLKDQTGRKISLTKLPGFMGCVNASSKPLIITLANPSKCCP